MNNVLALVDLHNSKKIDVLTEQRELASTTFLARYAFIDYALSNLINSGIDDISILARSNFRSISKHLGPVSTYLKNTKTGFLNVLMNEKAIPSPQFNTDVHNLQENDYILYDSNCKYVLITPVHFVYKIDFQKVIDEHAASGKVISVLYGTTNEPSEYAGCHKIVVDAIGNAQKFDIISEDDKNKEVNVSLETYVVNMEFLKDILRRAKDISELFSLDELFRYIAHYENDMNCIKHDGYFRCFDSLAKYYKYSFEIMDYKNGADKIFSTDNLLLTTTHNSRPVLYGKNADVRQSIVANGSTINGKVRHSILSRDVVIEEGASVEDCILFTHTVVKKGVHLRNVVADKRCVFETKKNVSGTKDEPLYVKRGAII